MLRTLEQAKAMDLKLYFLVKRLQENARRSLVTNGAIKKGEKFNEKNIIAKRPGTTSTSL